MSVKQTMLNHIEDTFNYCLLLVKRKNEDYAVEDNPFKNFEASTIIDVDPNKALLLQVVNKITRISNLLEKEAEIKEDKVTDSIVDAINYLALLKARLDMEVGKK